jgi:hypothetical protein
VFTTAYSGTSTAATTTYYDDTTYVTYTSDTGGVHRVRVPRTYADELFKPNYSISYNKDDNRFIVSRGLDYQDREFTTKRSAKRFAERWLARKNKEIKTKVPIYEQYKESAKSKRIMAEAMRRMDEARIRREAERLEMVRREEAAMEQEEISTEEDRYFERLGL